MSIYQNVTIALRSSTEKTVAGKPRSQSGEDVAA